MEASIVYLTWPDFGDVKDFFAALTWADIKQSFNVGKELFTLFVYFLAALAVIIGLLRINKILEVFGAFRSSNPTILQLYQRIDDLKELVPAIDEKVKALQAQIKEQVEDKLGDLQEQIDQRNQIDDVKTIQTAAKDGLPSLDTLGRDDGIESISRKWKQLQDILKVKVPNADLRRTSEVASRLMDRRRNNPLSEDDAKLIMALGSQYRRLTRVDTITPEEIAEFSAAIDKVLQRVQMVGQRSSATDAAA